jgi:hypothetical protein
MKKSFTFLFVISSLITWAQSGYEYLRIGDVRNSWTTQQGSIDTVIFNVIPKGLYTEIGVFIYFSARGTSYIADDSLEIQMLFNLPDKAEVSDMWLWVGNQPVRANVYDKWTASQVYEGIVKRRHDPAILYKYVYEYWSDYYSYKISDMYMLRIFPLMTDLPRKVKFTYLVPTEDLNTEHPYVNMPVNILALSHNNIPNVKVRYISDNHLTSPSFTGYPSIVFHQSGPYLEANLAGIDYNSALSLSFRNQYKNKQFTGTYIKQGRENFYEMNLNPNKIFNLNKVKKGLFLFDFIPDNCNTLNITQMLNELKAKLHNNFTPNDSFNIMISGMVTKNFSDKWLPADSATIENTINSVKNNDFKSYSSLPTLLIDGINFINEHNKGSVILIASSESDGSYQQANGLINDYITMIDANQIPIHILDLDNNGHEYQYIGNRSYYGNEYLYVNLCMQTIGDFFSIRQTPFDVMLSTTFQKLSGYFTSFDLYVTLENGYTYANYDLTDDIGIVYLDQTIQKVGKFNGSGRFRAIISAQLSTGEFFHTDFFIEQNDLIPMDSLAKSIWAAHMLRIMQSYDQTNEVIGQIINMSKQERILTNYTAFLALEPGNGQIEDKTQEGNPNEYLNVENPNNNNLKSKLTIYPNPVSVSGMISFEIQKIAQVKIMIYDIYGKLIKIIDEGTKNKGTYTVKFDASQLPAGTYFCRMSVDNTFIKPEKFAVIR